MKRLAAVLWLLPLPAAAQTNQAAQAPASLVRLYDGGSDCSRYPGSILKPNVSGAVQLRYTVGSDGTVTDVTITTSSGDVQLDRGAHDCARSWKFVPPQEVGLTAPVTAVAIATFAAADRPAFGINNMTREAHMNWRTPMVRSASSVAMADMYGRAVTCLRGRQELAPAAGTALPAQVRVFLSGGEISHVAVIASSGSDVLDKAVIACYGAVPKDAARAKYLRDTRDADIVIAWRTLYPQPAIH